MGLSRWMGAFLFLTLVGSIQAQPYKWIDERGQTCYGDIVPPGVPFERCFVPAAPPPDPYYERRLQAMRRYADELEAGREEIRANQYDSIIIRQPQQDGFVREEGTGIQVAVAVKPELNRAAGHVIQILLDGSPQEEGSAENMQVLKGVNRGLHTVTAQIVDSTGTVLLKSESVRFNYQRESRLHTAPFFLRPRAAVPPAWSTVPFPPVVPPSGPAGAAPNVASPDKSAIRARNVPPARRSQTQPRPPSAPASAPPTGGLTR